MKRKNPNPRRLTKSTKDGYVYLGKPNQRHFCSDKIYREIRYFQKSTNNLIPKLSFQRVVTEILRGFQPEGRIAVAAIEALQIAAEHVLVELFADTQRLASHARRSTIQTQDMRLVIELKPI